MKSYELTENETPEVMISGPNWKFLIEPDPKRPGLYKVSQSNKNDNYTRKHSALYGKKNQEAILAMIKRSREI